MDIRVPDTKDGHGPDEAVAMWQAPAPLTRRERQVVAYAALGHSNKLIAYELGLAPSSIGTYLGQATAKLGVHSRVALIRLCLTRGAAGPAPGSDKMTSDRLAARRVGVDGGWAMSPGAVRSMRESDKMPDAGFAQLGGRAPEHTTVGQVIDFPIQERALPGVLTGAEQEVVGALLEGATNAEIARRRGTALRTVANQVAALFRKLGVGSRAELAARYVPATERSAPRITTK